MVGWVGFRVCRMLHGAGGLWRPCGDMAVVHLLCTSYGAHPRATVMVSTAMVSRVMVLRAQCLCAQCLCAQCLCAQCLCPQCLCPQCLCLQCLCLQCPRPTPRLRS